MPIIRSTSHIDGKEVDLYIGVAFDQIDNRSYLAVWGGPGMGKTSFLELLTSPQIWQKYGLDSSQAVIVRLSCENIVPFIPSNFWGEVLSLLKDKLESETDLQAEIDALLAEGRATKDSLRQILRKLGRRKKFLVLLVDDYDAALDTNTEYKENDREVFLSECRNLAVHSQESAHLSMVVTSLKRLSTLGPSPNPSKSPWYNHYLFQSLKPFTGKEVDELLKPLGTQITPELRNAIGEITGGHPAFLQIAGSLLYINLRMAQWQEPDVQAFTKKVESDTRQILQGIWARCSGIEQTLLMLMALSSLKGRLPQGRYDLSGIDIIFSQKERELIKLEEQGVIIRSAKQVGKNIPSFTSSIIKQWVIQELENSNDASLQKRPKVFLNLMSYEQAKKVTEVIRWLWEHKDEIPSTLKWFAEVTAALPKGAIQDFFN